MKDNKYDIERVIRFSVNGREFTSLEEARREVLHRKIAKLLDLNFEGISSHWESVLYDRIIKHKNMLIDVLNTPNEIERGKE